jgi:hypothetical protein
VHGKVPNNGLLRKKSARTCLPCGAARRRRRKRQDLTTIVPSSLPFSPEPILQTTDRDMGLSDFDAPMAELDTSPIGLRVISEWRYTYSALALYKSVWAELAKPLPKGDDKGLRQLLPPCIAPDAQLFFSLRAATPQKASI